MYIRNSSKPLENIALILREIWLIHTRTTEGTKEKAVGGVTAGLLLAGDVVTWEAIHFGIRQRLTAKVTVMDRPYIFEDIMVKGVDYCYRKY